MAIPFIQKRKKQKNLTLILVALIIITGLVVWWGFFRSSETAPPSPEIEIIERIEIDFSVLEEPIVKDLESFEEIGSFEWATSDIPGRENPFVPF